MGQASEKRVQQELREIGEVTRKLDPGDSDQETELRAGNLLAVSMCSQQCWLSLPKDPLPQES